MFWSFSTGRATAAVKDAFVTELWPEPAPPIIACHGANGDAHGINSLISGRAGYRLLTERRFTIAAPTTPPAGFGDVTTVARVGDCVAWHRNALAGTDDPVVLMGGSMGATSCIQWARQNLADVAAIVLSIPLLDMEAVRAADTLGLRAWIDVAWNVTYPAALPTNANPIDHAETLSGIPIFMSVASDDGVSANWQDFAAAHGDCTIDDLGALGHTNEALAAIDYVAVRSFVVAHT